MNICLFDRVDAWAAGWGPHSGGAHFGIKLTNLERLLWSPPIHTLQLRSFFCFTFFCFETNHYLIKIYLFTISSLTYVYFNNNKKKKREI